MASIIQAKKRYDASRPRLDAQVNALCAAAGIERSPGNRNFRLVETEVQIILLQEALGDALAAVAVLLERAGIADAEDTKRGEA